MVQPVPLPILAIHLRIRVCSGSSFGPAISVYVPDYGLIGNTLNWAFGSPRELSFCKWRNTLARTKCGGGRSNSGLGYA